MKLRSLIIFLICAAFIGLMLAVSFYSFYLVYDIKDLPTDVKVSDHNGLNLDTDAVHFGRVTSPGGGDRYMIIANTYNIPLRVTVSVKGEMTDWVSANETQFTLEPGTFKNVGLSLNVPQGISYGNYTGTIRVMFMRILI